MANARATLEPRALAADQPTLYSYVSADLRYRFACGAFREWFGRGEREIVGRCLDEILPAAAYREAEPFLERALGGERVEFETGLDLPHGDKRVLVSLVPDPESEEVRGLFVVIRDVGEERRIREELRRREARMRAILDTATDGILTMDDRGVIESFNRGAERIFGYRAAEAIGRTIDLLIPHAGRPLLAPQAIEVVARRKDGGRVPVELVVDRFRERDTLFAAVVRDVSERKAREEEIRRERDFVERLIDTAPVAVLVLDREGSIVRYNRFLEEMSGIPLGEVRGESWFERFVPERSREAVERLFRRILAGATENGATDAIVTRSGDERHLEWHNTTLTDTDGTVLGVLAIGRDITERRELEEKFLQAQKMEAIGRLASGIAHDFNNLLMGIMGCAEMSKKRLDPASAALPFIEEIARAAGSGASITRELLNFTRRRREPVEWCDVRAVVEREWTMLRRLVGEDVELSSHVSEDDLTVPCGEGKLEQILMNLAVNARDAMREGGTLRIEAGPLDLDEEAVRRYPGLRPGAYVSLRVSDSGVGMDPETLEHAFEPFFTTKGTGEGTGLGLSTVYAIVSGAGGSVEVDSAPGQGTTFHLLFPRSERRAEPAPREEAAPPDFSGRGERALVVEDEPLVRRTVRHYLEPRGFEVIEAEDGDAALEALEALPSPPALLVTDVVLPGRSGTEIAGLISERHPNVATVLMSAHPRGLLADSGRLSPGAVSLQKPFGEEELTRAVSEAMAAAELPANPGHSADGGPTILLIEDSAAARLACRELLEDLGYRVLAAKDGSEASELARSGDGPIDLVVTDVGLPDVRGSDLVAELRVRSPGLPVLYVSGLSPDDPELKSALSLPGTTYVAKPVDFASLAERVDAMLGG